MKKILLPLLCCLMATSCLKDAGFTVTNFTDFAISYKGMLVTDNGYQLTVTQNESGSEAWKTEGERFYILCDILNRNLEINLKSLTPVDIVHPNSYTEAENEPDDPVDVFDHSISGGYINLAMNVFGAPYADKDHKITFYYSSNELQDEFTFYVLHQGNHENPAFMDEKKLETQKLEFSIPLWDLLKKNTPTKLNLCLYQLKKDEAGKYIVEKNTYPLHTGSIVL